MNNLGFIPAWQFNQDPAHNPAIVNMQFPPGMFQTTVQPTGPYYNHQLAGLGIEPLDTVNAIFDSWWWKNRKWIALGAVGALGLGILGGLTAILR